MRSGGVPFQVPGGGVAPWAALVAIAWMLTSVTVPEWAALAGALAVAVVAYVLTTKARAARRLTPGESTA